VTVVSSSQNPLESCDNPVSCHSPSRLSPQSYLISGAFQQKSAFDALGETSNSRFMPELDDSFQIVTANDASTGSFGELSEGDVAATFGSIDLLISYVGGDGNDVVLTAVAVPGPLAALAIPTMLAGTGLLRKPRS